MRCPVRKPAVTRWWPSTTESWRYSSRSDQLQIVCSSKASCPTQTWRRCRRVDDRWKDDKKKVDFIKRRRRTLGYEQLDCVPLFLFICLFQKLDHLNLLVRCTWRIGGASFISRALLFSHWQSCKWSGCRLMLICSSSLNNFSKLRLWLFIGKVFHFLLVSTNSGHSSRRLVLSESSALP